MEVEGKSFESNAKEIGFFPVGSGGTLAVFE